MNDDEKPRFLKAADKETWRKPADISWGDFSFNPAKPLTPKAKRLCQLVAGGMKQGDAAEQIGYSMGWASRILTSQKGKDEVQRFMEKVFEQSVADRVKALGTPALDILEELLTSDDPSIKPQLKADVAKWVAEKISGKAKQEVEYSGNIVHDFVDKLKALEASGQILDITPTKVAVEGTEKANEVTERDKLDQFLTFEAPELDK